MNTKIILSFATLLFCANIHAQDFGKLKGKLTDNNNQPISYANILLTNVSDSTLTKGSASNENGNFYFNQVPVGNYKLSISYIGFQKKIIENIKVEKDLTANAGTINLENDYQSLSEVTVVGERGATKIEPGKIIYKVSELTSQNGGTAGDILKNMPSVSMGGSPNHNRDVRLRGLGNGYTQVLINGRNSGITGNNRETVLDQIPASSIDYIEIITSPSAEYQSDGINGIINIVLKKNMNDAFHGNVLFMIDNIDGYNGNIGLSQQNDKYDLSITYDKLKRTVDNNKHTDKTNYKNGLFDGNTFTDQNEIKNFTNEYLTLGGKYRPWYSAVFGTEFTYGKQIEDKTVFIDTRNNKANSSFKDWTKVNQTELGTRTFYGYMAEFNQHFKNNSTLKASFNLLQANQPKIKNISSQKILTTGIFSGNPALSEETELIKDNNYFANLDYSTPFFKNNTLKMGYRFSLLNRNVVNSISKYNYGNNNWETSQTTESNFIFREETHAIYLSDELKWKFIKLNFGARMEQTFLNTNAVLDTITKKSNYLFILPNLTMQFNIDSTQYITLSFGERLKRPAFNDLNPFLNINDPLKIKQGNPDLRPEYAWTYELGYLKNFKKFNIGANIFYRDLHDLIQKVTTEDNNGILYEKPDNFTSAYLWGVELMTSANITKWWKINATYSYFDSKINDELFNGDAIKDQLQWSAKVITDFNLPKQFNIQIAGNYLGPKPSIQTTEKEIYFVDLGIEKTFLKNGKIMFRMLDVFDTVKKTKIETTDKSSSYSTENTRGQIMYIGLKWNF